MAVEVLYLQCAVDVLLKRFSATRRKHPMATAASPLAGIQSEGGPCFAHLGARRCAD